MNPLLHLNEKHHFPLKQKAKSITMLTFSLFTASMEAKKNKKKQNVNDGD